jgi:transposase
MYVLSTGCQWRAIPKDLPPKSTVYDYFDLWTYDGTKRPDTVVGFKLVPKRWIVERTIAWLNRCRRLAKDWENLNRKALAFLRLASIRLMLRKLGNPA